MLELAVQILPDHATLNGHCPCLIVHRHDLLQVERVDNHTALDGQNAAIAGGGPAAGHQRELVVAGPLGQLDQFLFICRLSDGVGQGITHKRADQGRHDPHVVTIEGALALVITHARPKHLVQVGFLGSLEFAHIRVPPDL